MAPPFKPMREVWADVPVRRRSSIPGPLLRAELTRAAVRRLTRIAGTGTTIARSASASPEGIVNSGRPFGLLAPADRPTTAIPHSRDRAARAGIIIDWEDLTFCRRRAADRAGLSERFVADDVTRFPGGWRHGLCDRETLLTLLSHGEAQRSEWSGSPPIQRTVLVDDKIS